MTAPSPGPLFRRRAGLVVGAVHLRPLPGSPRWGGDFAAVLERARADLLALAAVCAGPGAFIRVNVHSGAMVTDQGVIEGRADRTLRRRRELGAERDVAILADVLVKHAAPLGAVSLEDA